MCDHPSVCSPFHVMDGIFNSMPQAACFIYPAQSRNRSSGCERQRSAREQERTVCPTLLISNLRTENGELRTEKHGGCHAVKWVSAVSRSTENPLHDHPHMQTPISSCIMRLPSSIVHHPSFLTASQYGQPIFSCPGALILRVSWSHHLSP